MVARTVRKWTIVLVAAFVAAALGLATEARAGAPTEQLKAQIDRVLRVLDDPEMKKDERAGERRTAIRQIANEIFDFTETTRRSLGPHWQARTPAERAELTRLFAELLERSYIGKIELYSGERILYAGETIDGDHATVRTRLVTRQATEIPVDYRMIRRGERWLTYDVAIEGVSLVANYRAQFNKIVQKSGHAGLVKALQAKLEEGLAADPIVKRTSQPR